MNSLFLLFRKVLPSLPCIIPSSSIGLFENPDSSLIVFARSFSSLLTMERRPWSDWSKLHLRLVVYYSFLFPLSFFLWNVCFIEIEFVLRPIWGIQSRSSISHSSLVANSQFWIDPYDCIVSSFRFLWQPIVGDVGRRSFSILASAAARWETDYYGKW